MTLSVLFLSGEITPGENGIWENPFGGLIFLFLKGRYFFGGNGCNPHIRVERSRYYGACVGLLSGFIAFVGNVDGE